MSFFDDVPWRNFDVRKWISSAPKISLMCSTKVHIFCVKNPSRDVSESNIVFIKFGPMPWLHWKNNNLPPSYITKPLTFDKKKIVLICCHLTTPLDGFLTHGYVYVITIHFKYESHSNIVCSSLEILVNKFFVCKIQGDPPEDESRLIGYKTPIFCQINLYTSKL